MFQTAIPVIQVSGSAAAEEFYCRRLGFSLLASWRADQSKDDPRYMTLARDGARLHVHSFHSGTAVAGAAFLANALEESSYPPPRERQSEDPQHHDCRCPDAARWPSFTPSGFCTELVH